MKIGGPRDRAFWVRESVETAFSKFDIRSNPITDNPEE